jgi:hypothetical protein
MESFLSHFSTIGGFKRYMSAAPTRSNGAKDRSSWESRFITNKPHVSGSVPRYAATVERHVFSSLFSNILPTLKY